MYYCMHYVVHTVKALEQLQDDRKNGKALAIGKGQVVHRSIHQCDFQLNFSSQKDVLDDVSIHLIGR